MSSEHCKTCGKTKSIEAAGQNQSRGSITQWIFSQKTCDCLTSNQTIATRDGGQTVDRNKCITCQRPMARTRTVGSITQWIFGGELCSCHRRISRADSTDSAALDLESDKRNQAPLAVLEGDEIDAARFPIERYMVIDELGKGGTGTVYLCEDTRLKKRVAVKTLIQLNRDQLIAFQAEARTTSQLNHPGILKVLDFGPTPSGIPYLVFEYFDGISLDRYIGERGPLDLNAFFRVFDRITSALSAAHDLKILHRDLKPSNILISKEESEAPDVKLIDFGVAFVSNLSTGRAAPQSDTIAGTPPYMPPDTVAGLPYTARSEVYSLGCVMFESLTGQPPFLCQTALETINMHATAPPPLLREAAPRNFPEPIEQLIARCLAKNPDDRIQSMDELNESLSEIELEVGAGQHGSDSEIRTTTNSANFSVPALCIIGGLTAIVAGLVLFTVEQGHESTPIRKTSTNVTAGDGFKLLIKQDADQMVAGASRDSTRDGALAGNAVNQWELGNRYRYRDNPDYKNALYWYSRSAAQGNGRGAMELAIMYRDGLGTPANFKEAVRLLKYSAEHANPASYVVLGSMYRDGKGVVKNPREAARCFARAAEGGWISGNVYLASLYVQGFGVPRDYRKAMRLYIKGEPKKNPEAAQGIGWLYFKGLGVKQDYNEAFKWFEISALLGNAPGQTNLGWMYEHGLGVSQSDSEARQWYARASRQGYAPAQKKLLELEHQVQKVQPVPTAGSTEHSN